MTELRSRQVACALNYSAEAEVESGDAQEQRKIEEKRFEELSKAIDDAGHYEDEVAKLGFERGSTAFAIKLVRDFGLMSLGEAEMLHAISLGLLTLMSSNERAPPSYACDPSRSHSFRPRLVQANPQLSLILVRHFLQTVESFWAKETCQL